MQCGYLAIVDAYEHHDPEKGAFTTILGFYLKKRFHNWCASLSGWTRRQYDDAAKNGIRVESLNRIVYSDDPDEGTELGNLIPDPDDNFAELVDRLYLEGLHGKMDKLLNRLKPNEARQYACGTIRKRPLSRLLKLWGLL